jgi:hypothetical protein
MGNCTRKNLILTALLKYRKKSQAAARTALKTAMKFQKISLEKKTIKKQES